MKTKDSSSKIHKTASGKKCVCASCALSAGYGMLLIRLVVGVLFIGHGITKFMTLSGVASFLGGIGIPPWFAGVLAAIEVLGGVCLVLGFFSRWAGFVLGADMLSASTFAHFHWGIWAWLVVLLIVLAVLGMEFTQSKLAPWLFGVIVAGILVLALWPLFFPVLKLASGTELEMLLLVGAVAVALQGPGKWSLHSSFGCCEE